MSQKLFLAFFIFCYPTLSFAQSAVIFCIPNSVTAPTGATNPCTPVGTGTGTTVFPIQSN